MHQTFVQKLNPCVTQVFCLPEKGEVLGVTPSLGAPAGLFLEKCPSPQLRTLTFVISIPAGWGPFLDI